MIAGVRACSLALPLGMLIPISIAAAAPRTRDESKRGGGGRPTPEFGPLTLHANEPSDASLRQQGDGRKLNYVEASWEKVL